MIKFVYTNVATHLKKIVLILIFANLFLNCETKKDKAEFKKTNFYYPRISDFKTDSLLTKIYLDSIKNYGELNRIADRIACDGKNPLLIFSNDSSEFNLIVYKECSESNDIVDYSIKNIISIENNSIIINDEIEKPMDSLKTVLGNHILNPKKEFDFSQNIEKALIFYFQDSLYKTEKIKKQLIKLATEFNELNQKNGDNLPLKIKLSDYPYLRIETPPLPKN